MLQRPVGVVYWTEPRAFTFEGREIHFRCTEEDLQEHKQWLGKYVDQANRRHSELVAEAERKRKAEEERGATREAELRAREEELRKRHPPRGRVTYKGQNPDDHQPDDPSD